ncbi:MAG: D-arabinono-1,4-lactone oxidase [Acidimicrobiales bacterium]
MASTPARWRNWAANQECWPTAIEHPASQAELSRLVTTAAAAGTTVKVVGSGHSFTDIACTAGYLIHLDRHSSILHIDREAMTVSVEAGVPLSRLNAALEEAGMALPNLGDIAYQTVAGAISTSTHGTGVRIGGLATQVIGLDIVTGDGSVIECSADTEPDVFSAARVGLGAIGILSRVTLQCVPAFTLRAIEQPMHMDKVFSNLDRYVEENDHFEFFWVPHTPFAITKRNNRTDEPPAGRGRWRTIRDKYLLENIAFGVACRLGRMRPSLIPRLATAVPGSGRVEYTDKSFKIFASPRWVHFYEMEYAIPREHVVEALNRLMAFVDDSGLRIGFPVEVRFTASDDIWLSTAHGRTSAYIAVHVYQGTEYEPYLRGVESSMDDLGGRPHWGKMHFQTAETLAARYDHWDDFQAVRARVDPDGRFANAYTDRVLGPVSG